MKPFSIIAAVIFSILSLAHLLRLYFHWEIIVNGFIRSPMGQRPCMHSSRGACLHALAGSATATAVITKAGSFQLPAFSL